MSRYEALKAYGHSPAKAAEIILDAERGDKHALAWIDAVEAAEADLEDLIYAHGQEATL